MYQRTRDLIDELTDHYIKDGWSRMQLVEYLMKDPADGGHGYKTSYAYELIREVNKRVEEVIKETISDKYTMSLTLLQQQYHRAIKNKNDRLALEVIKEINKISGLYKEQIDLNNNVTFRTIWGDEDDDI